MSSNLFQRLDNLQRTGIKLGLRNIKALLQHLRNPESAYPSILIAGTNGKGSTGAMLEAILRGNGLRTGHYTSPHLVDLNERIRVDRVPISQPDFEAVIATVFEASDSLRASGMLEQEPTYFEMLTTAALLHFRNAEVQFAVVEVGLGGRFDATNAVPQKLSIVTNIDYDHQEYLGSTLGEIAGEKAGIFKPGVPVVTGILPSEATAVIASAASANQCELWRLSASSIQNLRLVSGYPVFEYPGWKRTLRINLRGRHQAENAGVALLACDALRSLGYSIGREEAIDALNKVEWDGRLDLIEADPPVLLDCAHNPNGTLSLSNYLAEIGWSRVIGLFTAMKDKEITPMLNHIREKIDTLILTRVPPFDRCADRKMLIAAAENTPNDFVDDSQLAFRIAREIAIQKNLPLVAFGSIYFVGEILRFTRKDRNS